MVINGVFESTFGQAVCTVVWNLSTRGYSVGMRYVSSEGRWERSV